jgi:hypothetical protein
MIVDSDEARRLGGSQKIVERFSFAAFAGILTLLVGSVLLGTGFAPLLAHSRPDSGWLAAGVTGRRAQTTTEVESQLQSLGVTLPH